METWNKHEQIQEHIKTDKCVYHLAIVCVLRFGLKKCSCSLGIESKKADAILETLEKFEIEKIRQVWMRMVGWSCGHSALSDLNRHVGRSQ